MVTDANGDVVQTLDYYPYGALRINNKTTVMDEVRKFTGHEYDSSIALSYMKARYYDGTRGQFLSQDPAHLLVGDNRFEQKYNRKLGLHLANPQGLNSYSYAVNNPLRFTDESGEILPFLAALGVYAMTVLNPAELHFTAADIDDTKSVLGSDAGLLEKGLTIGGLTLGFVAPGGGYGKGARKSLDEARSMLAYVLQRVYTNRTIRHAVTNRGNTEVVVGNLDDIERIGREFVGEGSTEMTREYGKGKVGEVIGLKSADETREYRYYNPAKENASANLVIRDANGNEISNTHLR